MARLLQEHAAWRLIAERIAEGNWSHSGLCAEIDHCAKEGCISLEMHIRMVRRVNYHRPRVDEREYVGPWAFPRGDAEVRVLAALFLAREAREEYNHHKERV